MPKYEVPTPKLSKYTNENLVIAPDMVDSDNMQYGVEAEFQAQASIDEGVSGRKSIDTSYENFSQDVVDTPRSGNAPMPADLDSYPHRRY